MIQRSLVLLKPDAVKRGICGEIIHRFERAGLKIIAMKMVQVDKEFAKKHYLTTEEYLVALGEKTLVDCKENKIDPVENMGSDDPATLGRKIWEYSVEYLASGPVVAMVLEGPMAILNIRAMVGNTLPAKAAPGTIRGDYALESSVGANFRKRSIYNLVHASGNEDEAANEIVLWFKDQEFLSYRRIHEDLYSF